MLYSYTVTFILLYSYTHVFRLWGFSSKANRANYVAVRRADARPPEHRAVGLARRGSARANSVARGQCRSQCHRTRPSAPHRSRVSSVARRGQRGLLQSGVDYRSLRRERVLPLPLSLFTFSGALRMNACCKA